ncbi:hypothetical protein [Aquimarina brevivitae]|uniref:Uncharacterized protein n=1 Tax=Aquimarina brevivitae TaxID=323412 RepID=A0A4Q7PHW1_9FLAO|nr:hypothetical protein [Aquimarina brevivitae]RZT00145.1 hypothetical protein EV197_1378 [Aquimarina brevivitae]
MKKLYLVGLGLLVFNLALAQQRGVTDTGEEVILYADGTWKYQNNQEAIEKEIPTNPEKFTKDEASTFLLKSSKVNVGFYLNPKLWSFQKAVENPEAEFEFQLKDEDLYGMILSEKVEIPLETLKFIALENSRSVAPDVSVVKEEYRNVNGLKVLLLQLNGTMQGIKFTYYGYYFSSSNGTIQFITYTSQNLMETYKSACEKLLNGLVELN